MARKLLKFLALGQRRQACEGSDDVVRVELRSVTSVGTKTCRRECAKGAVPEVGRASWTRCYVQTNALASPHEQPPLPTVVVVGPTDDDTDLGSVAKMAMSLHDQVEIVEELLPLSRVA